MERLARGEAYCVATRTTCITFTRNSVIADKQRYSFCNSRVKVRKHFTTLYVGYAFLLVCYSNFVRNTHFFGILHFKNAAKLNLKTEIGSVNVKASDGVNYWKLFNKRLKDGVSREAATI